MKELIAIQDELKAPKNKYNSFGEYHYRDLDGILEAAKPICKKHGALLTISDTIKNVGGWNYVEATARITNGSETVEVYASARETGEKKKLDSSQLTGTASSYARKYALNGLFLIDDTKDADTDEYKRQQDEKKAEAKDAKETEAARKKKITPAQKGLVVDMMQELSIKPQDVLNHFKISTIDEMVLPQLKQFLDNCEKKRKAKANAKK